MTDFLRQIRAALGIGLQTALHQPRHALLIMAGLLIAGCTLLVVLTIPAGLRQVAAGTGRADVAVVLANARLDESSGNIQPALVRRIGSLPGVARLADGTPLLAPQFVVHAHLARYDDNPGTTLLRGVAPQTFAVVDGSVSIIDGKPPQSGLPQLVAGRIAEDVLLYASTGADLVFRLFTWHVTGVFDANGSLWAGELWVDLETLRAAYNAQGQTTTVWVRLTSPAALDQFTAAMNADPQLQGLTVIRQPAFYASRVSFLSVFINMAALVIAVVLGTGAALAAGNAVGLALRARRRQLAVLRATGFGNAQLAVALVLEVLLLAALCASIAIGIGMLLVDARSIDSATGTTSIRFALAVSPQVMLLTLLYTLLLGLLGALIPTLRTVHAPLVRALARE